MKKKYIAPLTEIMHIEHENLIAATINPNVTPVAPDNNNNYGEGLGDNNQGSGTDIPESAKSFGHFLWDFE